jgi:allantoin racemase
LKRKGELTVRTILYYAATAGYDEKEQERRLNLMEPFIPDGYRVKFLVERGGPEFLDRAEDFTKAINAVKSNIQSIGPEDGDALISGGALDPGVPTARNLARIPVIAPGEASLYIAFLSKLPTTIITVDDHAVSAARKFVEETRLKPAIVSIRNMNTPVRKIVSDLEAGRSALKREANAAIKEDGAMALYLGCMTLTTLGLGEQLRQELDIPIFDPMRISLRMAVEVIESRLGQVSP